MRNIEKAVSLAIFVMILSSGLTLNTLSGRGDNPDETEEDLSPLFETLNMTAEEMGNSLDRAIDVNFTLDENLSYDYDEEQLNMSKESALTIEEKLSKPNSVFSEIEGKIGSDEFLEEYFVPFYGISLNLTHYSRRHSYFISNISAVIMDNHSVQEDLAYDLEEAFNNTHDHLDAMEENLESINKTVQEEKRDNINLTGLERSVYENERLLERYRDMLGDIGYELEIPPALYINGPDIVYPGEEFQIKVSYFDGQKFNTSANISILLDGEGTENDYRIDGSSYLFRYEVDWSAQLWLQLQVKAQVDFNGVLSEELVVQIQPYPSNIELETEKEAYYDGPITIQGVFETEAEIDLSEIELQASDKKTSASANGSFTFEFDSKEFRWGQSEVLVIYEGAENKTISPSSENVTFEVSIPTQINITDYTETLRYNDVNNFELKGRLINGSSEENDVKGLSNRDLRVYLNGEFIDEIQTDEEGFFNFSFSTDHELDTGQNVLSFSFEGSKMYRDVDSQDIHFEVVDEQTFWSNPLIIGGLAVSIVFTLGLVYVFSGKEEKEEIEESSISESKRETYSDRSIPSVGAEEDITSAYRRFLKILEDMGFIELSRGKTHREIEREINSHPQTEELKEEASLVTDLFEKALFTDRDISGSEVEEFNSSLLKLMKGVRTHE